MGDPRWNGVDEALDVEHTTNFRNLYTIWDIAGQFSLPQQADIVWSTAHYHDLHTKAYQVDMTDFLARVFEGINTTGGVLVIADYAAKPGAGFTQVDTLHRVDKEAVKAEVMKAGFIFDGESTIWAVPSDDHTRPVYEEITPGKADMFILKFRKPANASPPRRPTLEQQKGFIDSNFTTGDPKNYKSGGIWHNADGTYEEYPEFYGTWFMDAAGQQCLRHEYPPLAQAILGCHPWQQGKPGDSWLEDTNGPTLARVGLRSEHVYPPPPGAEGGGRGGRAPIGEPVENWDDPSLGYIK